MNINRKKFSTYVIYFMLIAFFRRWFLIDELMSKNKKDGK